MVLSKFWQKFKICTTQYITFLMFLFFWEGEGGAGDEIFPEILQKVSPKVSPKFWQNSRAQIFNKTATLHTTYHTISHVTSNIEYIHLLPSQDRLLYRWRCYLERIFGWLLLSVVRSRLSWEKSSASSVYSC